MAYSDLPGMDVAGPSLWSRESSQHLKSGDSPTRLGPRRHKRPVRGPSAFRVFWKGVRSAARQPKTSKKDPILGTWQRVTVCVKKVHRLGVTKGRSWTKFAHYLEREQANPERSGFTAESAQSVSIVEQLKEWEQSGDERLWCFVVSPEKELDLKAFTRAWLERLERENKGSWSWVAAIHTNTEHPHVHVILRAKDQHGQDLQFSQKEQRVRFREAARAVATEFLGYRVEEHTLTERDRERHRFSGQDRQRQTSGNKE